MPYSELMWSLLGGERDWHNGSVRKNDTFCESRTILFMAFRNFRPFPPLHMNMAANVIFMLI